MSNFDKMLKYTRAYHAELGQWIAKHSGEPTPEQLANVEEAAKETMPLFIDEGRSILDDAASMRNENGRKTLADAVTRRDDDGEI